MGRPETRPTRAWDRSGWKQKPAWELARENPVDPGLGPPGQTRVRPSQFFSCRYRCLLFLRPPHPGLLHLLPKEQNPSWRNSIEIHTLHLLLTSIHYNPSSPISLLRHQWRHNPLLLFPNPCPSFHPIFAIIFCATVICPLAPTPNPTVPDVPILNPSPFLGVPILLPFLSQRRIVLVKT